MAEAKARNEIKVMVTFPLAERPYHAEFAPETTVGALRAAAMSDLGVGGDTQYSYYLTHKQDRQPDETAIGTLAGHARAVNFTLVRELTQG